jgi:hypothetical protein
MNLCVGTLRDRVMMSSRAAILTFMIGGPLLWLPVFLAWALISGYDSHGQLGLSVLLVPAMGGFFWCLEAISPRGWLYTWIPTLGTALLYRNLVHRLPLARVSWLRARTGSMALYFALAAMISALVFFFCIAVGALVGLHAPLLPSAQDSHGSFGLPDRSLTGGTVIGLVSIIGGLLGAALGAVWPAVEAPAAGAVQPVASQSVLLPSLSLRPVICTFFVVGPLLYLPLMSLLSPYPVGSGTGPLARSFSQALSLPMLAPVGAIAWYGALLYPPQWLQTWIPTLGTAYLFWAALARFPVRRWASSGLGECGVVLGYAMTCGALSVIVFALCQLIDGFFTHAAAVRSDHGEFMDLLSSAAGHTMLMAVAILGVILGGAVYILEMRKSRHR